MKTITLKRSIDEKKCRYCKKLEDEYNFILDCDLYKDIRKHYIIKYFWNRPNIIKVKEL